MTHHPVGECAARLNVSRRTIERYIADGKLRIVRLSQRRIAITAESPHEMLGTTEYLRLFRSDLDSEDFVGKVWEFERENFYVDEAKETYYDLFVLILDMEQEDKLLVVVRLLEHRFLDGSVA